jgi:DNA modification methylase
MKLTEIKSNPNNPRVIKDHKFEKLKKSISEFPKMMELRPMVINEDNIVLGGNMRLKALKDLGYKEVPEEWVKRASDLTEEETRRFIIADNVGFGEHDWEMLANEWDTEELEDWGLEGFPFEEVTELEAEEDDYTEPDNIKVDVVLGDLIEIGEHRLLCGDSTDSDQVAKLMNGNKAELLFTSPPYSDMREYNGGKDLSVSNISDFIPTFLPFAEYQAVNLGMQIKEREVYPYWDEFIQKGKDCGYKLMAWNVWHKTAVNIGQQRQFFPCYHEWIFVFGKEAKQLNKTIEKKTKGHTKSLSTGRRQADGSIKVSSKGDQSSNFKMTESVFKSNPELGTIRGSHPATFPIELPSEYIKAMTNEEDIITEPFCGSGTTMVAAHQLKRKCYGMELDPKYCQVIIDRMSKLNPSLEVKINGVVYNKQANE